MERRLHERIRVQFEAKVTDRNHPERATTGVVSDISASGISVMLPLQFAPGDRIELEMADSFVIGRVVYATAETSMFRTGIEVAQVRLGSTDLSRLLQKTLNEALPGVPGLEYSETLID
jgi:hypothetical protein